MTLTQAIEQFIADARVRGLAPQTLIGYRSDLDLVVALATVEARNTVLAFTPDLVRKYFHALSAKGLTMATLHRRRATLSEFSKWGLKRRLWIENPMGDLPKIRRPKRTPRPFRSEEVTALMQLKLGPRDRAVRAILYYTGLRAGAVVALRLADISLMRASFYLDEGRMITVPGSLRARSKGGKESVKPMHPELHRELQDYVLQQHPDLDPRAFLFSHADGRPWERRMLTRMAGRWGRAAGVVKCIPHRFRHSFATDLLRETGDLRLVQQLMDHEDIATTALYTQVVDGKLAEGVLRLRSFEQASDPAQDTPRYKPAFKTPPEPESEGEV